MAPPPTHGRVWGVDDSGSGCRRRDLAGILAKLEREKEGTPRVKSTSWSSSRVLLAYCAKRGERPSLSGGWGPGMGVASWPAARMRRPTADRRSLSTNTATSMALQGFTSSRAVWAMRAARRDCCWLPSPRGLVAGGLGSSSEVSTGGNGSRCPGGRGAGQPSLRGRKPRGRCGSQYRPPKACFYPAVVLPSLCPPARGRIFLWLRMVHGLPTHEIYPHSLHNLPTYPQMYPRGYICVNCPLTHLPANVPARVHLWVKRHKKPVV